MMQSASRITKILYTASAGLQYEFQDRRVEWIYGVASAYLLELHVHASLWRTSQVVRGHGLRRLDVASCQEHGRKTDSGVSLSMVPPSAVDQLTVGQLSLLSSWG